MFINEKSYVELSDFHYFEYFPHFVNYISGASIYLDDCDKLFHNCIIYLSTSSVLSFIHNILPKITVQFILITGFSDDIIPYISEDNKRMEVDTLLSSDKLTIWFGLNKGWDHPKIISIPAGICRSLPKPCTDSDKFMAWCNPTILGPFYKFDIIESTLKRYNGDRNILDIIKSKENYDLFFTSYTTITNLQQRYIKFKTIRSELDIFLRDNTSPNIKKEAELLDWVVYTDKVYNHKFYLAPPGATIDSYQILESLYIGTIPIIFKSPLSHLYSDLPVVIIEDYNVLTEEFLNNEYNRIITTSFSFEKITFNYWKNLIFSYKER